MRLILIFKMVNPIHGIHQTSSDEKVDEPMLQMIDKEVINPVSYSIRWDIFRGWTDCSIE